MPEGSSCAHARSNRNQSFKNVNLTDEAPRAKRENSALKDKEKGRREREREREGEGRKRETTKVGENGEK